MHSTSSTHHGWSDEELAERVATDLIDGSYVNLGIGLPLLVAGHIAHDREVVLHSENGLLGLGPTPDSPDKDVMDAGKRYASLTIGASAFDSSVSFGMVRGGHLDVAILGAMQVSGSGDLANWIVPGKGPGVGGAMDLAAGATQVWVMMRHLDRKGMPKIVTQCNLPLTAPAVVTRIYTDLAVFEIGQGALVLHELAPGVTVGDLRTLTGAPFVEESLTSE